jgi:CDP-glucose 4,6-dehydratase
MIDPGFWKGRKVLLTGHSGFKGSWMALWLARMGAQVHGLSLKPDTDPSLYEILNGDDFCVSHWVDIRDRAQVARTVAEIQPQICIHMAAQALVRRSYAFPAETFDINVQGTVNVLDALLGITSIEAVVAVTSDKVYLPNADGRPHKESDMLGGHDPYSASKAACELVIASYRDVFFAPRNIALASARAGNVVGGGDWAADRLVPDLWRARYAQRKAELRYPAAVRPWQHVLEPVSGYLLLAQAAATGRNYPHAINFGPKDPPSTVGEFASRFFLAFGDAAGWIQASGQHPPETHLLRIDASYAASVLGWRPQLDDRATIDWTASWYAAYDRGEDMKRMTQDQLARFAAHFEGAAA